MRELLRGLAIGVALLLVVGAVASRAGWADIAVPRPEGTGAWLVARASGFAAFVALSFDVLVGLVVSTRVADRRLARGQLIELHGWLSPLALALVLGHAAILLADSYIHFDALDLLIPFVAPYRPLATGLGVLAAYLALVVHASFGFRKRLGTKLWRRLHYLSFAAFAGGALHGILAGTDSGQPWAVALYAAPLALAGLLVARRISIRA
ncbi:MAG TPA: ferric reductase-like transmembrane domain-containing protein [Kofleriaceae bacterium]|nr:ferric reductase-like transmembrane domain-containing protein [Kofleriaceae bacterium]